MTDLITADPTADPTAPDTASRTAGTAGTVDGSLAGSGTEQAAIEHELVVDDLLVEDVSIDGMCGVY